VLIWVYYSAQLVLMGAEFTNVYARRYGSRRHAPAGDAARSGPKAGDLGRARTAWLTGAVGLAAPITLLWRA
jgi:membrane protein